MPNCLCSEHCIVQLCVYLINVSQLAVDVLAEFQQQAYRTLIKNMQVKEKREQALGESRIL